MLDDISKQFAEQREAHWKAIVDRMPEGTPAHVVASLRYEFLVMLAENLDGILVMRELRTTTEHRIFSSLRPHIATAFIRMACELKFSRDPASIGSQHVKSRKVARGLIAKRDQAKRLGVR